MAAHPVNIQGEQSAWSAQVWCRALFAARSDRSPEAVPHRIHTNPSVAIAERTPDAQRAFKSVRTNEPEQC
jgi:hypothetical protein